MGIPHGEPSRREIRSENHTRHGQNGVLAIDRPHPGALSLELLWAERSGKGVQAHGNLSGLVESVWVLETRLASPGRWCATWDGGHSTGRRKSGHSWPLPNRWEMHPLLALRGDKELPAPGPETRTKGFLHMFMARRHRHVTFIMWSGFPLGENPLVLSHHCRGLIYSRPKVITLDAADIRPSSFWNCLTVSGRPSLMVLTDHKRVDPSRGHTCLHRGQIPYHAQISGSL